MIQPVLGAWQAGGLAPAGKPGAGGNLADGLQLPKHTLRADGTFNDHRAGKPAAGNLADGFRLPQHTVRADGTFNDPHAGNPVGAAVCQAAKHTVNADGTFGAPGVSEASRAGPKGLRSDGEDFVPLGVGIPSVSEHVPPERELYCVRMVIDKPPELVGQALTQSLLEGKPGVFPDESQSFTLPWPVAPEWKDLSSMPPQFQAEKVWEGGQHWESMSFFLGLRPLRLDESIEQCNTEEGAGYAVEQHSQVTSRIFVSQRKDPPFTFDIKVWSNILDHWVKDAEERPYVSCTCCVRKAKAGKRTRCELIRSLLYAGPVVERAERGEGPCLAVGVTNFMLEMEARSWLTYRAFPLVEVWRGVRRPEFVYHMPVLNVIQSYALGSGHATASSGEQADGPCYNVSLAQKLSAKFPDCPQGANHPRGKGPKGREFTEGNVSIESFAAVLDRVCRRASPTADIYRKFVDLGSGRGHAVLAAHALFPFRSCVGCELVPEVFEASRTAARTYEDSGLAFYALSKSSPADLFMKGDFFRDLNWADASIVFANALTFPKHLIQALGQQALRLRPGAVFIIAVKPLPVDDLAILQGFDMRGEAVLMGFMEHACRLWAYQRR